MGSPSSFSPTLFFVTSLSSFFFFLFLWKNPGRDRAKEVIVSPPPQVNDLSLLFPPPPPFRLLKEVLFFFFSSEDLSSLLRCGFIARPPSREVDLAR